MTAADVIRDAVRTAHAEGTPDARRRAVRSVDPVMVEAVLHATFTGGVRRVLCRGVGASPGAAIGQAYFTIEEAMDAADRGERVILVRPETTPADEFAMRLADGILTSRGGMASHAAVVARGWGLAAVVGAEAIMFGERCMVIGDTTVSEGAVISLDGGTGEVLLGALEVAAAEAPDELETLLEWADDLRRGRIAVRANADTPEDARRAREFGAEGIGLCRTEHQFLGGQLPIVQRLILAVTEHDEQRAMAELVSAQRRDMRGVLEAMDGLPVTVRLLDPPVHEFLPRLEELTVAEALGTLDRPGRRILAAARAWHEVNPMLGTRGVRLAILKPSLYRLQVRALVEAMLDRIDDGGEPIVEVMVPLVIGPAELSLVLGWIRDEITTCAGTRLGELQLGVGTMIETPRAALLAEELGALVDFFSFGTNDLTQLLFGFSRDDVERRLLATYLELGLLEHNPFETLDPTVAELVADAIAAGRRAKHQLKTGLCGEHGGDPASIRALVRAGIDYVSCSPFRIPVARLAAAHAVL
jgi:pyruvate,orthophosphate dikinase